MGEGGGGGGFPGKGRERMAHGKHPEARTIAVCLRNRKKDTVVEAAEQESFQK